MTEDAWNTRDPARVALAYTIDSRWRNRTEFLQGRLGLIRLRIASIYVENPALPRAPELPAAEWIRPAGRRQAESRPEPTAVRRFD